MADTLAPNDTYFATADTRTCAEEVLKRKDNYYKWLNINGTTRQWATNFRYFFGGRTTAGQVQPGGQEGEYRTMNVNHFRNLLLHIKQLVTSQRPAFEPRAVNSDPKSQKQTILARGILDYYMREKRVERDLDTALDYALAFGEGFVHTRWDANLGNIWATDPETNKDQKTGDVISSAYEPIDVIRDPLLNQYRDRNWLILRNRVSKWILAETYPEYRDQLLAVQPTRDPLGHYRFNGDTYAVETDLITMYTFYHAKDESCPDGRMMTLIEDDLVLTDGPLPYRHIPVQRLAAAEIFGSPFGYTVAYDLSALQEAYDAATSAIKSNQEMFAVQNILVPQGMGFNVVDLGGQLKAIEYDATSGAKPEPLNLLSTPREVFEFLQSLEAQMMTISGVNSVSRGDPQASLKSGAALALVQSMSIQFNQALQASYVELLEDVGSGIIHLLQDYANAPRMAAIAGKYNRSYMEEFTGDDLDQIDRVIIDAGNPMMSTVAGKMELAQTMLQAGFIKMPDELLSVINTGSLQPLTQGKTSELLQLAQENEMLKDGEPIQAIITDDHVLHISEHKSVVADPAVRKDPAILSAVLEHLQQHIELLKDPGYQELLQLMGQPGLGQPQAPQGPGIPQQNGPQPDANAQVASMQPSMPSSPKNAMTQNQWNPQTGGL